MVHYRLISNLQTSAIPPKNGLFFLRANCHSKAGEGFSVSFPVPLVLNNLGALTEVSWS